METHKKIIGNVGEDIACKYLKKKKYKIVDRNVHVSHNEIDIIAENKTHIVFVEVKTRTLINGVRNDFGSAGRAVDLKKRNDTVKASMSYLKSNFFDKQPRIDVIEVYLEGDGEFVNLKKPLEINHIENAFDVRGRKT